MQNVDLVEMYEDALRIPRFLLLRDKLTRGDLMFPRRSCTTGSRARRTNPRNFFQVGPILILKLLPTHTAHLVLGFSAEAVVVEIGTRFIGH
jgi:hypothetical protein